MEKPTPTLVGPIVMVPLSSKLEHALKTATTVPLTLVPSVEKMEEPTEISALLTATKPVSLTLDNVAQTVLNAIIKISHQFAHKAEDGIETLAFYNAIMTHQPRISGARELCTDYLTESN